MATSAYPIAVIMQRIALANPWTQHAWEAKGVVPDIFPAGAEKRVIVRDADHEQVVFPGLRLTLVRDEAEGYYLNLTSPKPKVFVLWRMREDEACPEMVTVSYHEGARWADSGENVDGVALPAEFVPWIGEFVEANYHPEPRRPPRYATNKDRGRMGRPG